MAGVRYGTSSVKAPITKRCSTRSSPEGESSGVRALGFVSFMRSRRSATDEAWERTDCSPAAPVPPRPRSDVRQRLIEIGDQIVRIFHADRVAYQAVFDADL